MRLARAVLRWLLTRLYRVRINGLEHFAAAGERVLIVANHTSFLDAVLLAAFLPERVTFAINSFVARAWWVRPLLPLVQVFPMDPTNPLSVKGLVRYLRAGNRAVIFPEGRITVTGALMKIYDGTGLIADRAGASVLPVRIDGAQYTPFSRLRGRVRLRWFPPITLTVLAPRSVAPPPEVQGRERRKRAGALLTDLMTEMMFATSDHRRTLFQALLDARRLHGGRHQVVEDVERRPWSYDQLLTRTLVMARLVEGLSAPGERVGLLLPSLASTSAVFLGLSAVGRVPAMLNFTVGPRGLLAACETAGLRTVLTARRFLKLAKLEEAAAQLEGAVRVVYLEDLAAQVTPWQKLGAALRARFAESWYRARAPRQGPGDPAVVLFTSGSEGHPKGVVLSHANLLANREQLAAKVDFSAQDVILNALPLFHSFGLTAGTLLPLLSGMKTFFYPSPLHYRIVPEMAYDVNATVLFGTNTFLAGYARYAHPYDFYSVRYVFAGAERLQEETRRQWASRFGIRILEGYGATETAPVLAANTPMAHREGTVGRFLPGIEWRLEPLPGVAEGGRLFVKGPNVMLGYLLHDRPGELVPPPEGWYDTGDIVSVDADGFVTIRGRAKRFAKVGGEMVSLTAVEELAARLWPGAHHAVVALADPRKGEQLVLVTTEPGAERGALAARARADGFSELGVPRALVRVREVPVLGTGKTDYAAVQALAEREAAP
jgi:acyl-[acyl-carrier-protein]-phospholipid O-acyltransferase/long-chain-fatty-acid--[acyl-carrier-protein] ligase